ncbi:MAG: hypothetical protein V3R56_05785 [Xanthomonadales bacterium]
MHTIKNYIMLAGLVALSTSAVAQEEEGPSMYTYATYFYCDVTGQDRVDEIVKNTNAPVYDQMVKEGKMSGWGWLAHHTGGKWRRIQYHQAPSVEALLDAQEEMGKRLDAAADGAPDNEFGKICNAHDDYIWAVEAGSSGDSRGKAGFSVYYRCDESKEERADEIFKQDFGPLLDKYVAAGKFTSWGWSSHWVGGKYRRLQTMTATSHKALLKARGELIDEMYAEGNKAGEEFTKICGSHVDYMWDIQLETP